MLIARYSAHIHDDIKRNWSSWNFGADGFKGTREDLYAYLAECSESNPVCISGFEIFQTDLKDTVIRELYSNYWVVVDTNRGEGLSCHVLESETVEEALAEIASKRYIFDGTGEGQTVDCKNARVLYSERQGDFGLHILEV